MITAEPTVHFNSHQNDVGDIYYTVIEYIQDPDTGELMPDGMEFGEVYYSGEYDDWIYAVQKYTEIPVNVLLEVSQLIVHLREGNEDVDF